MDDRSTASLQGAAREGGKPPPGINRREALKRVGLLLGGALSAPAISGVLSGCRASGSEDWTPQVLKAPQNEMITQISERIIPATDTPGAKAAHVNRFVDKMLADWYPAGERKQFLAGLADTAARAKKRFGTPFMECSSEDQIRLLAVLDREAFAAKGDREGERASGDPEEGESDIESAKKGVARVGEGAERARAKDTTRAEGATRPGQEVPFFRMMKELTLLGYYTSDIGMNQELQRRIVPGRYDGCMPLTEVRTNLKEV